MPENATEWLGGFDSVLEHRIRLAVCALLAESEYLTFTQLKKTFGASDGNLGAQLRKLEEVGYVKVNKLFQGRRPQTRYQLATTGRKALDGHLAALEQLVRQSRNGISE